MHVVPLFVIGVCAAVALFVTTVHTTLIIKLFFSPVSIVFVIISLRIIVAVIIPSSIISSRFTVLFAIGE